MRRVYLVVLVMFGCCWGCHGMGMVQYGPVKEGTRASFAQPDWPSGIMGILKHESRVCSTWVNGNERVYFEADPEQVGELIALYSDIRLRDHTLRIVEGVGQVRPFGDPVVKYNVELQILAGIALGHYKKSTSIKTFEPELTVSVDSNGLKPLLEDFDLPENIILVNEVTDSSLKGKAELPSRTAFHAKVQFDDGSPATDFEHGVSTRVTYWEKGVDAGVKVGRADVKGDFVVPFSEEELESMRRGDSWLTLTVGNSWTEAISDHPRLEADDLFFDKAFVRPVSVWTPRYYFGRILLEDGSALILDKERWPRAEIRVSIPYGGSTTPDADGFFKVFLTDEQFEEVRRREGPDNVTVHNYGDAENGPVRFSYPLSGLSKNRELVGVLTISAPEFW